MKAYKCVVTGDITLERHHIYTRKAYPELSKEEFNQIPLSRYYHTMAHHKGMVYMAQKFPMIESWLKENGWEYCEFKKKWAHQASKEVQSSLASS